ncbi:MAG: SOS response-associated peptidase family protein, partial [Rhizobiaceae bacterium]
MCGRFALTLTPEEVQAFFALVELEDFPPRYNIAPTQPILMVMSGEGRTEP